MQGLEGEHEGGLACGLRVVANSQRRPDEYHFRLAEGGCAPSLDLNPPDGVLRALRVMPEVAYFHGFISKQLRVDKPAHPLQVLCLGGFRGWILKRLMHWKPTSIQRLTRQPGHPAFRWIHAHASCAMFSRSAWPRFLRGKGPVALL